MRILIVSHGFPPHAQGGAEIYAHDHAVAMARAGEEVFVLTRDSDAKRAEYSVRREQRDGLTIAWINNTFADVRSFAETYCNPRLGHVASALIAEWSPDVAHVHHLTCLSTTIVQDLAAKNIPVFYTLHDYWLLCHRGQLLDVDFQVCDGPEPNGCGACLGMAASVAPSAYVARQVVQTFIPAAALQVFRRGAAAAGGLVSSTDHGTAASRARLEDMREVTAGVTRFLAPSRHMRDRFVRFGIDPSRITVSEYGSTLFTPVLAEVSTAVPIPDLRGVAGPLLRGAGARREAVVPSGVRAGAGRAGPIRPDSRPTDAALELPPGLRPLFALSPSRRSESRTAQPPHGDLGLSAGDGPLRLGFLGSLMVSKAPHLLLESCARLPSGSVSVDLFGDHVDYHGDTSYRARLAPLLTATGVRQHGKLPHENVGSVFEQIDVLVVPSIWPENSPLVIREAFLAGVPVVASRIGGIPETVTDEVNGLLFTPGDVEDLRRVLARLIREPDLLARLKQGIPAVRTLDDDVASMLRLYAEALDARPARRRLAAVVLNYRTPDDTFLATRSLLLSTRPIDDIIVVDNDSTGACRTALEPLLSRITYVPTGANLGFSGGMNVGIRQALARGAERVLVVNSDLIVPVDGVAGLERALDATPGAGIVGPVVMARHAPDRVSTMGIDYNRVTGRMRHRAVGARDADLSGPEVAEVAAVSGCLMLVARDVFEAIGLFDEDYFFGFEDLDLCLRARDAGYLTVADRRVRAFHEGGRSLRADAPQRFYFGARNHLLLARRSGRGGSRVGRLARQMVVVALNAAHACRAQPGSVAARLHAVARGTRDYFAGRFGADLRSSRN